MKLKTTKIWILLFFSGVCFAQNDSDSEFKAEKMKVKAVRLTGMNQVSRIGGAPEGISMEGEKYKVAIQCGFPNVNGHQCVVGINNKDINNSFCLGYSDFYQWGTQSFIGHPHPKTRGYDLALCHENESPECLDYGKRSLITNMDDIEYFTIVDLKDAETVYIKKKPQLEVSIEIERQLRPNSGKRLTKFSCEFSPDSKDGSRLWFQATSQ